MGIFDAIKDEGDGAGGLAQKAEGLAAQSGLGDQADQALQQAGQFADQKTGGSFSNQIDQVVNQAQGAFGQDGRQQGQDQNGFQDQGQGQDPSQNQGQDPSQDQGQDPSQDQYQDQQSQF